MPEALISRITSRGPGVGSGNSLSSSLRSPRNTTPFMASSWYDVPPALRDVDPAYVAGRSFSTEISEAHLSTGVRFTSEADIRPPLGFNRLNSRRIIGRETLSRFFDVRTFHPSLHLGRIGRPVRVDATRHELAAALQHRPDRDDRRA